MHELGDLHSANALTDHEVVSGIVDIIDTENALAARKYTLLAQYSRRGLNLKSHHSNPARWLAHGTRVHIGNAARQFTTAEWLTTTPTVLDALAAGDIHTAHVKEIHDGYRYIETADSTLTPSQLADATADLLAVAHHHTSHEVKARAHELAHTHAENARARFDKARHDEQERKQNPPKPGPEPVPEPGAGDGAGPAPGPEAGPGPEPAPGSEPGPGPRPIPVSENAALNTLQMYVQTNGRHTMYIDLDALAAEKFRAAIAAHSRPTPGADGSRDPRSAPKRNADALIHILDRYARTTTSGTPAARVNVIVKLEDLLADGTASEAGTDWPFHLTWTGPISHNLARLLSGDADLNPIITDEHGVPLAMGHTTRLATPEQRTAVVIRDRGCIKCGRAAHYCQIHHIIFWRNNGPTDLNNLALVCTDCHTDIHHRGWDVTVGGDGHPLLIPPPDVDPQRKPVLSYHRRRRPAG